MCTLRRLTSLAVALSAIAVASAQTGAPTMPLEEVERGQKGYGLSVFAGTAPERFEVEVLGVMRDAGPGQSYILARLTGQGLEETGVVAGMSGSPVFIEDRLVGAVAFAWPFTRGAVGGITPIDAMLALSAVEAEGPAGVGGGPPTSLAELRRIEPGDDRLRRELERLRGEMPGEARSGLLWSLSGFGPRSRGLIEPLLLGAAPSGVAEDGGTADLSPGSAVAGVLVDGDLKLAVTGTVTERIGPEIFAFGHSFLGQGPLRLPMATAEIVTVLSNQLVSFKIANVGAVVGAFDLDRSAGVRGRMGAVAETIPLRVRLAGLEEADFEMELADVPVYLPLLVAISSLGTLDSSSRVAGDQGLDLEVTWELDAYPPLRLAQSFDGSTAGLTAATYLLLMTNYLVNNPLEPVGLEGVTVDFAQHAVPRTTRILRAWADRTIVRPGERVAVTLELEPYRGEAYERTLEVVVPTTVGAGAYSLMLGDGVTMDGVRQMVERIAPETFEQSLDLVRRFHSNRDLVGFGLAPSWGLSLSGRALPSLPGSVRQIWQGVAPGVATPLGLAIMAPFGERFDAPLAGAVRIDLEVVRPKPVTPREPNG